jgi:anaerobic selenocysteine-containing dehydrogenase
LEKSEDLFKLCQKCRRETFTQKLIGKEIYKVNKIPYAAKRPREKIEPAKVDGRTGATVYQSQCFICNAGCDAIVWVKDGRVMKEDFL